MLRNFLVRHWLSWLIVTIVMALALPALTGGASAFQRIPGVGAHWLLLLIAMVITAANMKVVRFRMMLSAQSVRISQGKGLRVFFSTAFAANATPASVAAPFVAIAVLRRFGVSAATTMAAILVVSVFDALVTLSLFTGALFWLSTGKGGMPAPVEWVAVVAVILLIPTFCYLVFRNFRLFAAFLLRLLERVGVDQRVRFRAMRVLFRFRVALAKTSSFTVLSLLGFVLLGVAHQVLWYSLLFAAVQALGGEISWPAAFVIQLAAAGGARLLLLPGGAGGAEVGALTILSVLMPAGLAASAILLWRVCGYYLFLLVGFIAFIFDLGVPAFRTFAGQQRLNE